MTSDPKQGELFELPQENREGLPLGSVKPAARKTDPETSKEAARVIGEKIGDAQRQVLGAFLELGPMTARQAERLARFERFGFSTVRKRISELAKLGKLTKVGVDREGGRSPATIYKTTEQQTDEH